MAFLAVEAVGEVTVAPHWSSKQALTILIGSAAAIGVVSEILVSVTEGAVTVMGLSEFFVSNWLEGVFPLLAYAILGVAFFFF